MKFNFVIIGIIICSDLSAQSAHVDTNSVISSNNISKIKAVSEMVVVPAGYFAYQGNYEKLVYLKTFQIDKYEVTTQLYCEFLNSADPNSQHYDDSGNMQIDRKGKPGSYTYSATPGFGHYPVAYVSYYDTQAYAAWRSETYGGKYRLPTEQEWEKAAAWDPKMKKEFKYGYHSDVIDSTWCNYNDNVGHTIEVGWYNGSNGRKEAKSYYGCYDMSGNLWEWTSSDYGDGNKVIRGGYRGSDDSDCRSTYRGRNPPSDRDYHFGFRLVKECE